MCKSPLQYSSVSFQKFPQEKLPVMKRAKSYKYLPVDRSEVLI